MTPGDDGIRVVVRAAEVAGARTMITYYEHGNLVTPWLVRYAIEQALASGWDPRGRGSPVTYRIMGVLADRAVLGVVAEGLERREEDLIDAVADDEPDAVMVYADWLMERGDVRGEYIALADAAERGVALDANDKARLEELQAQRGAWLGPIVDVTRGRWWKRGLFDSCQLGKRVPGAVDRALGHVGWATVRSVDAYGEFMTAEGIARLVVQPQLRSLRLLALDYRTAREVVERASGFPHLVDVSISKGGAQYDVLAAIAAKMERGGGRLTAHVNEVATLVALLGEVETLRELVVIDPSFEKFVTWLPMLADVPSRAIEVVRFAQIVSGHEVHGGCFDVRRGPDGNWSALSIGWSGPDWPYARNTLRGALARLPPTALTAARIAAVGPLEDRGFRRMVLEVLMQQRGFQDFGLGAK